MFALAMTLALAAAPAEATAPRVDAPHAAPGAPIALDGPEQVRAFCASIELPERAATGPDVVARGEDLTAREDRRATALESRYRVALATRRLPFAPYHPEARQLELSERAVLSGAGGALRVWAVEDERLPVQADPATAQRIVQAAARGTLTFVLTFALPEDEDEATCAHAIATRQWVAGVEPVAWEYAEGGRVLARGGEGSDRPTVTAAEGARPRVEVAEPIGQEGSQEIRAAVVARIQDLQRCYGRALQADPALDGAFVAEVDLREQAGAPRSVRTAAESLQDEAMVACVEAVLGKTTFPGGYAGAFHIPIHFELEAPQARQ
jgi:hypothetical protein